ncbi:MAG: DUF6152 family protein [Arenicellaceae bacterium]|nr:DUF6152 family protein [Arenicellaceae bacterium]
MKILRTVLLVLALGGVTLSAVAHHSVYGVFDKDAPFKITGVVTETRWINPHVFLHLDVTDQDGNVTEWRLETAPTAFMRKGGITKEMLSGDGGPVSVSGITATKDPHIGWVHRITYADGHFYQLANVQLDAASSQPSALKQ